MSLVALSAGVLNTWKRFAVPAATPVLLNLSIDRLPPGGSVPGSRRCGIEPIYALAVGVMLGGVLQLAVQIPGAGAHRRPCRASGSRPSAIRSAWRHPGVRRILRQMAPALIGVSVAQFSLLINTQIASHQGVGAVSWLFYADRLMEFPTALLGVALGAGADAAALGRGAGSRRRGRLLGAARLGPAPGAAAGAALRGGPAGVPQRRWWRCCSTAARSTAHDVAQDGAGADGLRRRPDRPDRREDPGARLLRPPGHAHAGEDRHRRAGPDAVAQPAASCRSSAMPAWRCRSAAARWSTPPGSSSGCAGAAPTCRRRAGAASSCAVLLANVAPRALLLPGARVAIDWIGLGAHPWRRVGWLALFLAAEPSATLPSLAAHRHGAQAVRAPRINCFRCPVHCSSSRRRRSSTSRRSWPKTTSLPLIEAAASIAQDDFPQLDTQAVLAEIDALADKLRRRIPGGCGRGAAPALAQPLLLPGARLRRQRQRLLRPGQQLPALGARDAARHSRSRWRCSTSNWPPRSA